jgi:Glutamine amidotransferase domain
MARICGALGWPGADPRRRPDWPSMRALLGPGAVESLHASGPGRLATWSPGGEPPGPRVVCAGPDATAVFAGYLRDLPPGCPGEAALVLARYHAGDWKWLRGASGVFAFAVVDHRRPRCVLGVDRLGMRPLLVAADESGVAFASDLGVVGARRPPPREIDADALQELIAVGFPLGDRTALRGVERVPPGSILELTPEGRALTRYWWVSELAESRRQDADTFVDESRARLRSAIARLAARSAEPPLCLLSAGYDSRRILLEGHAAGVRFETATAALPYWPLPGTTIEPVVTSELCHALGAAHCLIRLPGALESGVVERDRGLRDTVLDYQVSGEDHIWAVPLLASLPVSAGRVNFDGLAGDTFFNNPFYGLPHALWGQWRPDQDLVAAIAPGHREWDRVWNGLVSRPLADRIAEALNALPEGPARLSLFYLLGRTRRVPAILPYGMLDLRIDSVCPYLDYDVMDHAWMFDPVLKGTLRLQRVALDRHFPEFAHLPSSHSRPEEVRPRYRVAMDFAEPGARLPLTLPQLAALVRAAVSGTRPGPFARDLAFAGLSALRLGHLGGGWREGRLRCLLHALNAADWLGHAEPARQRRVRDQGLAWLAGRPAMGGTLPRGARGRSSGVPTASLDRPQLHIDAR